ncbi:hypothetical protein TELCIR_26137 [Teladorsagia circumcincta]|uniref:Uncharacterized protein n=1 Tax=Teladorsagia circumcincta TaxID=45464 RepID=A0A2G9T3S2_TELCI|nr:hypothetical protein TELCIR_26137 [Teladorsagia circumcincta]
MNYIYSKGGRSCKKRSWHRKARNDGRLSPGLCEESHHKFEDDETSRWNLPSLDERIHEE